MELLYPLIVLNSVVGALALLLVVADRFLGQYGDCRITLNGEKELVVKGGDTLLACLLDREIIIPCACGGRGTCGYCQIKVSEGGGPVLPSEESCLTREQLINGYRLACQVKVRQDLMAQIPQHWLSVQKYQAEIAFLTPLTSTIKEIVLKLLRPGSITFQPGQYIQIKIPAGRTFEYRSYSIVSDAKCHDKITLNVRLIEGGVGSTYLHSLKEGNKVEFVGPYGDFVVKDTNRKMICVAGGVGLAPIKCIIASMLKEGTDREIVLFYGAHRRQDLCYYQEFKTWEERNRDFHFIPAIDVPEPGWEGEVGLITEVAKRYLRRSKEQDKEAYLCGPFDMMDVAINILVKMGIKEENIGFDKF